MKSNTIKVKFFGSLREYGDKGNAEITMPWSDSVKELQENLFQHLLKEFPNSDAAQILRESAFADDKSVLSVDANLSGRTWVAVLPPVCGG